MILKMKRGKTWNGLIILLSCAKIVNFLTHSFDSIPFESSIRTKYKLYNIFKTTTRIFIWGTTMFAFKQWRQSEWKSLGPFILYCILQIRKFFLWLRRSQIIWYVDSWNYICWIMYMCLFACLCVTRPNIYVFL